MLTATRLGLSFLAVSSILLTGCSGLSPNGGGASSGDGGDIVAYVDDVAVTKAELDELASVGLKKLDQERYELYRRTLEQMAIAKKTAEEAEAKGMTVEEYQSSEVQTRLVPPTDAEVAEYYELNKDSAGGRSFEQLREPIREMLTEKKRQALQAQFTQRIRASIDYRMTMEPPRTEVELLPTEITRGPDEAPITIVEYADFECPYCRRSHPAVERILAEYGDKIRFAFRDYPLPNHNRAVPSSVAAHCAAEQDKYWDYHQHLMVMKGSLSDQNLMERAQENGLDMNAFQTCYQNNSYPDEIAESLEQGRKLGVSATPTFFINGRMVIGARPYDELKGIVEEELVMTGAGS